MIQPSVWAAIAILSALVLIVLLIATGRLLRRRSSRSFCPKCGYDIRVQRRHDWQICPECGSDLNARPAMDVQLGGLLAVMLTSALLIVGSLGALLAIRPRMSPPAPPWQPTNSFDYTRHALMIRGIWQKGWIPPDCLNLIAYLRCSERGGLARMASVDAAEEDLLARAQSGDDISNEIRLQFEPCLRRIVVTCGPPETGMAWVDIEMIPPLLHRIDMRCTITSGRISGIPLSGGALATIRLDGIQTTLRDLMIEPMPGDIHRYAGRPQQFAIPVDASAHPLIQGEAAWVELNCRLDLLLEGEVVGSAIVGFVRK